jgi:hypothetical protein
MSIARISREAVCPREYVLLTSWLDHGFPSHEWPDDSVVTIFGQVITAREQVLTRFWVARGYSLAAWPKFSSAWHRTDHPASPSTSSRPSFSGGIRPQ